MKNKAELWGTFEPDDPHIYLRAEVRNLENSVNYLKEEIAKLNNIIEGQDKEITELKRKLEDAKDYAKDILNI